MQPSTGWVFVFYHLNIHERSILTALSKELFIILKCLNLEEESPFHSFLSFNIHLGIYARSNLCCCEPLDKVLLNINRCITKAYQTLHKKRIRRHQKYVYHFSKDLLLVILGIRTACLYDYADLLTEEAQCVLTHLHEDPFMNEYVRYLTAYSINDNIFFVNNRHLILKMTEDISFMLRNLLIVEVSSSSSGKEPMVAHENDVEMLFNMFRKVADTILMGSRKSGFGRPLALIEETQIFDYNLLPTIAGWILDYPSLYFFKDSSSMDGGNNLSWCPLMHVVLRLKVNLLKEEKNELESFTVQEFSFPQTVINNSGSSHRSKFIFARAQRIAKRASIWDAACINADGVDKSTITLPHVSL